METYNVLLDLSRKNASCLGDEGAIRELGSKVKTLLVGSNPFEALTLDKRKVSTRGMTEGKAGFSNTLPELWRIDASGCAKLRNVSGLAGYCSLGFVNLSGCNLTWEAVSSLANVNVAFLDLENNPKLRQPGLSEQEYRLCVIALLPKVWVLDGEVVRRQERKCAEEFLEACDATHPVRQACAHVDEFRASHWSPTLKFSDDATWFWEEGMNREPLSPFRKDEFRMNVAARLCERQLLAEQSYRYVQARTTDPKVFPLWTTSAATAIAKKQLNQFIGDICEDKGIPELSSLFSWPLFLRQLVIGRVLSSLKDDASNPQLATHYSEDDNALLCSTQFVQPRSRGGDVAKNLTQWPNSVWLARTLVLLALTPTAALMDKSTYQRIQMIIPQELDRAGAEFLTKEPLLFKPCSSAPGVRTWHPNNRTELCKSADATTRQPGGARAFTASFEKLCRHAVELREECESRSVQVRRNKSSRGSDGGGRKQHCLTAPTHRVSHNQTHRVSHNQHCGEWGWANSNNDSRATLYSAHTVRALPAIRKRRGLGKRRGKRWGSPAKNLDDAFLAGQGGTPDTPVWTECVTFVKRKPRDLKRTERRGQALASQRTWYTVQGIGTTIMAEYQ